MNIEASMVSFRQLDDGSTHEVLKNFPTEPELRAALAGLARDVRVEFLHYYWTLTYRLPGEAQPGAAPSAMIRPHPAP